MTIKAIDDNIRALKQAQIDVDSRLRRVSLDSASAIANAKCEKQCEQIAAFFMTNQIQQELFAQKILRLCLTGE